MAKKKAAAKGKAKKKGEPEKVSEKDLFLLKIANLQEDLQKETKMHDDLEKNLGLWKGKNEKEVDSKEACVEHLKRELGDATERGVFLQKQLSDASDARKLNEERVRQQLSDIGRRKEEVKSLFLQQKMELEGRLSVLEELRLQRNSLRAAVERVEAALLAKRDAEREQTRDVDEARVRRLRLNRDAFEARAVAARHLWEDAFEHRLVVYAQALLRDNAALRARCRAATERLLRSQDRHRGFRQLDATLKFESEVDAGIEERLRTDAARCERQIAELSGDLDDAGADAASAEDDARMRLEGGRSRRAVVRNALCRMKAGVANIEKLLREQHHYLDRLQRKLDARADSNGVLSSVALGAGDVLKRKRQSAELSQYRPAVDWEILQELRAILEAMPIVPEEKVGEKSFC